jgi:homogentisate 1,2-dioxygenase
MKQIESCFLPTNPSVSYTPLSHTWGPPQASDDASGAVSFVDGLQTIGGHGDPTLKEGVAVHQYAFSRNMHREAFVDNDGDLLLVPQLGTLDITTEMGRLYVRQGDIAVIPAGIRFAVSKAGSGSVARGYALEIFGAHFALPELGPIGGNGLAHARDFAYPVAAFEVDHPSAPLPPRQHWKVAVKLAGRLYEYTQPHTPFDVVAWHGRYAPYKYSLSDFGQLTSNVDQLDPTAYTVLTAPSKWPGVSLVDLCIFGEKWAVAADTVRLPYFHRTVGTEMCGVIRGEYKGSVRPLEEGGLSFEQSYMPHGESYDAWKGASERALGSERVGIGYLGTSESWGGFPSMWC